MKKKHVLYGSDHPIHVRILKFIKQNNHKYFIKDVFTFDEFASYYPILYHWILSRFFFHTSIKNPKIVQKVIHYLRIIFFNLFIYSISFQYQYKLYDLIILNIIFLSFPFSYTFWNAKNTGLSARSFGLMLGEIFVYSIYSFLIFDKTNSLFIIFISSFLIIMSSMMATQFLIFTSIIFSIYFSKTELLVAPILGLVIKSLINFKLFISYIRGLYNYYFNYYKYLSKLILFDFRKNIFRDFVYDFWKLPFDNKKTLREKLLYIYLNPIIELFFGFPYLTILVVLSINFNMHIESEIWIVYLTLIIFFIICLNPLRFLGEPQRYLEFIIPIISIIFYNNYDQEVITTSIIISSILTILVIYFSNTKRKIHNEKLDLINFVKAQFDNNKLIISNDHDILKYCAEFTNILTVDTSKKLTIEEVEVFFKNRFNKISVSGILNFYINYKPDILIINNDILIDKERDVLFSKIQKQLNLLFKNEKYCLYKINKK